MKDLLLTSHTKKEPKSQSHHVVLRARFPVLRLTRNKKLISTLLLTTSKRFQVKVYNNSLNSNHIHLLVKAKSLDSLNNFLRVLTGQIAQQITHAVRGKKLKVGFWLKPIWKRLVHWGRDFLKLHQYIFQNQLESLGLVKYRSRKKLMSHSYKTLRVPSQSSYSKTKITNYSKESQETIMCVYI